MNGGGILRYKYHSFLIAIIAISFVLSGCTANSVSAFEDGTLPLEEFQSEDGAFEYEKLPIGLSKEETAKRLGLENIGEPIATLEQFETFSLPEDKGLTFEDWTVTTQLEFKEEKLDLIQFQFREYKGNESDTLVAAQNLFDELTKTLEDKYGDFSTTANEDQTYLSHKWESHSNDMHTAIDLSILSQDGKLLSLSLFVGQQSYANE